MRVTFTVFPTCDVCICSRAAETRDMMTEGTCMEIGSRKASLYAQLSLTYLFLCTWPELSLFQFVLLDRPQAMLLSMAGSIAFIMYGHFHSDNVSKALQSQPGIMVFSVLCDEQ